MLTDNDSVKTTLISGDPEVCKALLFETAISWAKEGRYVYYFAPRQLDSLPLSFHDRTEPSADALKLITFIYTPTYDDLVAQLVRLHTFARPASVLLIDDLDHFAAADKEAISGVLQAARCCAVVLNTAKNCSNVTGRPVHVCAASFAGCYGNVYSRYFDMQWLVSSEPGDKDTDEARRVWIKDFYGKKALEYCRLDDAVLVLKTVYAAIDLD